MLEATIRKYQNRTIEAAQCNSTPHLSSPPAPLQSDWRGWRRTLPERGGEGDSAVKVLGEPILKDIARELVAHVRKSVTIDWTLRESAQAQIHVLVRRILRKYGYPPDKQEKATQTVLEQAKLLCAEWAA
jgi:type I restriction enzyme, R subunit